MAVYLYQVFFCRLPVSKKAIVKFSAVMKTPVWLHTIFILDNFVEQWLSHSGQFTRKVRVVVHSIWNHHSSRWVKVSGQQWEHIVLHPHQTHHHYSTTNTKTTQCLEKHPGHFWFKLAQNLSDSHNFWWIFLTQLAKMCFCALFTLSNKTTLGEKMQYFVGSDFPKQCKNIRWVRWKTT